VKISIYNKIKALAVVLAFAIVFLASAGSVNAWGPARPTFTGEKPATYPTFNSITNNPAMGDEREFVRIREAGSGAAFTAKDTVLVPGKTYEIEIFFHNNASDTLNASGVGLADNVKMSAGFPSVLRKGERGQITGIITSPDATPKSVWDELYVTTNETVVYLKYVPDSAIIHSNGSVNGSNMSPNLLFSETGDLIGYGKSAWGLVPGCAQYAGYVSYKITVSKPDFSFQKHVRLGTGGWQKSMTAKAGDIVEFRLLYKNTGGTEQANVTLRDVLPAGMEYVQGSTMGYSPASPNGVKLSDNLFGAGLNIGTYQPGDEAYVIYKAKVLADSATSCDGRSMKNSARATTSDGEKSDNATVVVDREDCEEPEKPSGDCDDPEFAAQRPDLCDEEEEPPVPPELPQTGPFEVLFVGLAVAAVGVAATYWYRSRKLVKGMEAEAEGVGKGGEPKAEHKKKSASDK